MCKRKKEYQSRKCFAIAHPKNGNIVFKNVFKKVLALQSRRSPSLVDNGSVGEAYMPSCHARLYLERFLKHKALVFTSKIGSFQGLEKEMHTNTSSRVLELFQTSHLNLDCMFTVLACPKCEFTRNVSILISVTMHSKCHSQKTGRL